MADLLNKLNDQNQAKEDGKSSTSSLSGQSAGGDTLVGNESTTAGVTAGDDLISETVGTGTKTEGAKDSGTQTKSEKSNADSKSDDKVQDSGTWTKESALLEVKKLREENKLRRLREKEIQSEYDKKFEDFKTQMQNQMDSALEAKKELEALKAKEEDKKRSIEEKLAHRESLVAETQAKMDALKAEFQRSLDEKESMLKELQAQQEAQLAVYRSRIEEELESIPESKRKFANIIVKGFKDGSQDPREAWTALAEAKAEGVFDEKQVVVSHATPGADSARMTQERLSAAADERRSGMTASQKIGAGLKEVQNRRGKIL